ncbi:hypothetical protein [Streptomyces fructofermentans]|uniref:Zinc-finger domain-containing protein n=1 Tax=Streptomyces fructofermentans TaxID=152141 RepID=A0A918KNJ5_9ACTN|nr:hypothetical protein [Streptomyces fructofermentans]GGX69903.1 hypothetical protein GCM10010515_41940 [Streptomyces fructofermentans]
MTVPQPAPHLSPADLAQHALDGARTPWSAEAVRHLRACAACRSRLAAFERVVAAGRSTYPYEALVPPAPRVWEAISSEVRADAAPPPAHRPPAPAPSPPDATRPNLPRGPAAPPVTPTHAAPDAPEPPAHAEPPPRTSAPGVHRRAVGLALRLAPVRFLCRLLRAAIRPFRRPVRGRRG